MTTIHWSVPAAILVLLAGCGGSTKDAHVSTDAATESASPTEEAQSATPTAPSAEASSVSARTQISGCLARQSENLSRSAQGAGDLDELPSSLPKRPSPGEDDAEKPELTLATTKEGVQMRHVWRHACCLTATVAVSKTAGRVDIAQTISGTPCRCMCQSVISTDVPLSAGDWEVVVQQHFDYGTVEVHREQVTVPRH